MKKILKKPSVPKIKKIKLKMSAISLIFTVVVLACLIVFNMVFGLIADKMQLDIDLTRDKVYEFSELTEKTIASLDKDVTAYVLEYDGADYAYLMQLLEKYSSLSSRFSVKKINPYKNPEIMTKFPDIYQDAQNKNLVILECGELYRGITHYEIFPQNYTGSQSLDAERQITNGIRYVVGQLQESVIHFTVGHNEADSINLVNLMIQEGYRYNDLDLKSQQIDPEASIVISYMPADDFSQNEIKEIESFIARGGNFILVSTSRGTGENLRDFTEKWGITPNRDFMLEKSDNYYLHEGVHSSELEMQEHTITKALKENELAFLVPLLPNTLTVTKSLNGAVVTPLLKSSQDSYAKTDALSDTTEYESGDPMGPFVMAALSESNLDGAGALCVIAGCVDSSFADAQYISSSAIANCDFVLNTINYLGGTSVESGIRAKNISPDSFTLEPSETKRITLVLLVLIPLTIFLAAFVVWIRRRFK